MALAVIAMIVLLILADGRPRHMIGFVIYGASLITLYGASALAHSVHCSPEKARRLDRVDYIAIFLLIAGTFTPICLVLLRGPVGWSLLIAEWAIAAAGTAAILWGRGLSNWRRVFLYLLMGWLVVVAIEPLTHVLPVEGLLWLFGGGVIYSGGAIIFATNRPRLWPGKFTAHDLWHVLVMAGSACHFMVMIRFVA